MSYQIIADASGDLTGDLLRDLPFIDIIPMEVVLDQQSFTYGPGGDLTIPDFYRALRSGKCASTSQINPLVYQECFRRYLSEGKDVLYLGLTAALSGSLGNAQMIADELREEFPDRKIFCPDTCCASGGQGMFIRLCAQKQMEGYDIEQLVQFVEDNKDYCCHWFTVDTLEHLKRGGRISPTAAAIGTLLQVKPLLHVIKDGSLEVAEKPRGTKKAMKAQMARMEAGWRPDICKTVCIAHADCRDRAEELRDLILAKPPEAEILLSEIGPVIGAHVGPGMLMLGFWGDAK